MNLKSLQGNYNIVGVNQDFEKSTYKGVLNLKINNQNQVIAKWIINNEDEQFGVGFYKNQTLVINFYYENDLSEKFTGTVSYKCITQDYFEGIWSEADGDSNYIGEEQCYRIESNNKLLN